MRILLIEDDQALCQAICVHLEKEGYPVDICCDGEDALYYALQNAYSVIILDRMLPGIDGLTLLQTIRRRGILTPVIMATAMDTLQDKINGLDCGADDYIVKPFDVAELLARIRAQIRRPAMKNMTASFSFGDLVLDPDKRELLCQNKKVSLSQREASMMEYFLKNPQQTLSRTMILTHIWGADADVEEGNLDNYIYFLRKRLRTLKSRVQIKTLHKMGYRMEDSDVS